jgi:hypothetical protein
LVMRLMEVGFTYDVIQDLHEGDLISILAILSAKHKKAKEDQQANASRR